MKVLQNGETQSETHHRCRQTQCTFFQQGGCKACEDCHAEPYEMKNDCLRCTACENIPDALRWGNKNHAAMNAAKQHLQERQKTIKAMQ